jgi:hypothetical protein
MLVLPAEHVVLRLPRWEGGAPASGSPPGLQRVQVCDLTSGHVADGFDQARNRAVASLDCTQLVVRDVETSPEVLRPECRVDLAALDLAPREV